MTNTSAASKLGPNVIILRGRAEMAAQQNTEAHNSADALTPELLAAAAQIDSSTLHEAAGRIGSLPSAIKAIAPGMTICGPAFPVKGPPLDNLAIHFAIDEAQPGDVIVADVSGGYEGGYFGEVMATSAKARQLGGLVIDGCVRDGAALAQKGWPVFARGLCMRGTLKDLNGDFKINETLAFGDVIIAPGDLVLGDGDGVVVIPKAMVTATIEASIKREAAEAEMMEKLKTGVTAVELRAWKRG
jgi:4-hydroxy-4-methyl-2-oxoglutarate aldolase